MADKKLEVIPLGGLGEFGMNMTAIRYGDDILVVDCGMMFPEAELLGVDLVMPDLTYLKENQQFVQIGRAHV
jgi:ribonuclease J